MQNHEYLVPQESKVCCGEKNVKDDKMAIIGDNSRQME